VFDRGAGARPAEPRLDVATDAVGRRDGRRRRFRRGPGGRRLAAERPAAGRSGEPSGQRVRIRGRKALQQDDGQTLSEHRRRVHDARQSDARSRAVRVRRRGAAGRHVRPGLDPDARAAAHAPQLQRVRRQTDRIPDVAAVRPGQAS